MTGGALGLGAVLRGKGSMELSNRETWALIHGMVFGALFLLAFGGGFAGLYSLREQLLTSDGVAERTPRLLIGTVVMAIVAWLAVIIGTWVVYPWYRAVPPQGTTDLGTFPKSLLLSSPSTADWHNFAMEWKEHVAWFAPFLATAVAFAVAYYGVQLVRRGDVRRATMVFFVLAFAAAGIAGLFGALITKAAPV
jgi:hypothetical protein